MKKYISKPTIILIVLLIWAGFYIYSQMTSEIPFNPPTTLIKYNGKSIPTSLGDHSWVPKSGGSSYETAGEYGVGLKTSKFTAKPGDVVHILIPSNPKSISISQLLGSDYSHKEYKTFTDGKIYILNLPIEKGEYIFEVFAKWDTNNHNTATIFRVEIK